MDLRTVKTEKAIYDAFFQLRKKYSLDKVKVKNICDLALINKTTFYRHYTDVYNLSEKIENELSDKCFEAFKEKDVLISEPKQLLQEFPVVFSLYEEELLTIFTDNTEEFFNLMSTRFRNFYRVNGKSKDDEFLCMFIMGGIKYIMKELKMEGHYSDYEIIKFVFMIFDRLDISI